jgi:hypothetical protein
MDPIKNPFSPGAGSPPPELVGRDPVLTGSPVWARRCHGLAGVRSVFRGIGGRAARVVEVPLGFLGPGRYLAEIYRDDPNSAARLARRRDVVTTGDAVRVLLAPAGGLLVRLSPVNGDRAEMVR